MTDKIELPEMDEEELSKILRDMTVYGTGIYKITEDGIKHIDVWNGEEE